MDPITGFCNQIVDRQKALEQLDDYLDDWEDTTSLNNLSRVSIVCDILKKNVHVSYFLSLSEFVCTEDNVWKIDINCTEFTEFTDYVNICKDTTVCDEKLVKKLALKLLRTLKYRHVRRFLLHLVFEGLDPDIFCF